MVDFRRKTIALPALLALLACTGDGTGDGAGAADTASAAATAAAQAQELSIGDVGFATPESVLHDEQADVYLVSNINGEPAGKDDNGFISRVRPDGTVEALKWIDGASADLALHAPKGLALRGDTLFVADIDSVRAFHRTNGAPLGARGVPNASFLNDVAVGPDGALYVSDTGVDASFSPVGTDAVYRFTADGAEAVARASDLGGPNGILVEEGGVVIAGFRGNALLQADAVAVPADTIATLPAGQLDGLIRVGDGAYVVSSWEGSALYRVAADGVVTTIAEGLESPADIGFDARRRRVLVPLFMANRIAVQPLR